MTVVLCVVLQNFREGNWEKAKHALEKSAALRLLTKTRDGATKGSSHS